MKLFPTQPWFQRQDAKDAKFAKSNKPSFLGDLGDLGVLCVLALEEPSGWQRLFHASRVARRAMDN